MPNYSGGNQEINPRITQEQLDEFFNGDLNFITDDEGFPWQIGLVKGKLSLVCDELCAIEDVFVELPNALEIAAAHSDITSISIKRKDGSYAHETKGMIRIGNSIEFFGMDDPDELMEIINEVILACANMLQGNVEVK